MEPDTTEATSTLGLRQEVKLDKIAALYRHLGVTDNPGPTWIGLGSQRIQKKGPQFLNFATLMEDGFFNKRKRPVFRTKKI